MTAQITLQQGPLGVAASVRRRDPEPGTEGIGDVTAGNGARSDPAPARDPVPRRPMREKEQPDQAPIERVSPRTLFETSRIAAALAAHPATAAPPSAPRATSWTPPASTLALRDRTV